MTSLREYWKTIFVACVILYTSLIRELNFNLPFITYGDKWAHLQECWFYPRRGKWLDWLADSVGVLLGGGVTAAVLAIKSRHL